MGHYALLNSQNYVNQVITGGGDNDDIMFETLYGDFHNCIAKRTSYNTRGGIHYQADNNTPSQDQSKAFRKNYAGIGYYYDSIRDAFIPPKPFPSWTLNEETCLWESPIPYPNTENIPIEYQFYNRYAWNEINYYWELKKPYNNWTLHEDNYYISPIPYPNDDGVYFWNEETQSWNAINNI